MALVMKPANSSICTHIGYDPDTQELCMRHPNEKTSVFSQVPLDIGEAMENAESVGRMYHSLIKGQYPHRYL